MSADNDKKGWTPERVRLHLQNAVYLEMWTVPLYLTAAYSIKAPVNPKTLRPEFAPVPSLEDGTPNFALFNSTDYAQYAFNSILAIAIQEMLHVELVSNILNAVRPTKDAAVVKFTGQWAPSYKSLPPNINAPLPSGVTLKLGPLDENQARLFEWIEHKEPQPLSNPHEYRDYYPSIGAFYESLSFGLKACWADLYPPQGLGPEPTGDELRQKDDWGSVIKYAQRSGFLNHFIHGTKPGHTHADAVTATGKYPFSIKIFGSPKDALTRAEAAMTAIVVQGEGAGKGRDVPTRFTPLNGNPIEIALDRISHWERFTEILNLCLAGKITTYAYGSPPSPSTMMTLQRALSESNSSFLVSLENAFATTAPVGIDAMRGLGNRTLQVWQSGGIPEYQWINPASAVDPTRTKQLHACQGLNMCAGLGANGTGTKPGDGDCATAWIHVCAHSNSCAGQGGCGYAAGDPAGDWQPNYNSALHKGGCGAPIPSAQVFSAMAPVALQGKNVWTYARQLMRSKVSGFPATDPEPNEIRKLLTPTSAASALPPSGT